jgi:recombination protein RecT
MAQSGKGNEDLKNQLTQNQTQMAKVQTVKSLLDTPEYKSRFTDILKDKAPQFMASIINVSRGMDAEPKSVIMAAAIAATLDLPIDKNLGYAWIVPFKEKGNPVASFQMGWKGYVQLALRTGQYKGIGAVPVYEGEVKHYDELLGIIDYESRSDVCPDEKPVGYVAKFRLTNGFEKALYWSKAKCEAHAKRYSQTFKSQNEYVKNNSKWATDFDAMALKTILKQLLSKWGILSVEMKNALKSDDGVIKKDNIDDDGAVIYPDNSDASFDVQYEVVPE